jgi:hypothetical protein
VPRILVVELAAPVLMVEQAGQDIREVVIVDMWGVAIVVAGVVIAVGAEVVEVAAVADVEADAEVVK